MVKIKLKSPEYYSYARTDIVDLVTSSGSMESILDVGCGYGYTGELLKNKGAVHIERYRDCSRCV